MSFNRHATAITLGFMALTLIRCERGWSDQSLSERAKGALSKGVDFFHHQVATEGGYVFRYAPDLVLREGELKTGPTTVWIQPPATPAVGLAYLEAYILTREPSLLAAAKDTAKCLVRGQLHSGGWSESIEFAPSDRQKIAYRVDGPIPNKAQNSTTLDDNKSQSVIEFLARLDQALEFKDPVLHEATLYALDALTKTQYPNGAWPQRFSEPPDPTKFPVIKASYPDSWPREFPKVNYMGFYTLNDSTLVDTLRVMMLAHEIYGDERYRQSALRAGEFLLLAQMPGPQPAWAQQYNVEMQPAWARKFEPPAVTGGESQKIIDTLIFLYSETGDRRFYESAKKALEYLARSVLPSGKLARFYELKTNRPLYFTRDYVLTYEDNDLPTHYSFVTPNSLSKLEGKLKKVTGLPPTKLSEYAALQRQPKKIERPKDQEVERVIAAMDSRGAWVVPGKLSNHQGENLPSKVIESSTFIGNLRILSRYLARE